MMESKCKVCHNHLVWCKKHQSYHHQNSNDCGDNRYFDALGNPDDDAYRRNVW